MTIKKIFFTFLVTSLTLEVCFCTVPDYIQHAPGSKEYPHADGLILKQEFSLSLLPGGTVRKHYFSATKVLTEYFKNSSNMDPKIPYNSSTQSLQIIQSRTYRHDGTFVDTQQNGFNEITPFALEYAPDYTHLREMIVTHVGVELNCTNVLEYELTELVPSRMPFWGELVLQGDLPILEQTIEFNIPAGQSFQIGTINYEQQPVKIGKENYDTYTLTRQNVPAVNIVENPDQAGEYLHRLVFSTVTDWDAVKSYLSNQVEDVQKLDNVIREKIKFLTAEAGDKVEAMECIHHFVATKVVMVNWPLVDFNFSPRSACQVYYSGYGHNLDKAILLAAMLAELNINSQVVLAASTRAWNSTIPSPAQFNQVWIFAKVNKNSYPLNPMVAPDHPNLQDIQGAIFSLDQGSPKAPAHPGSEKRKMQNYNSKGEIILALDQDSIKISGTLDLDVSSAYAPFFQYSQKRKNVEKLAEQVAAKMYRARVANITVSKWQPGNGSLHIELDRGQVLTKPGMPVVITIPLPINSVVTNPDLSRINRTVPFFIRAPLEETQSLRIKLPEKMKVVLAPQDIKEENTLGMASVEVKVKLHEIYFKQTLLLTEAMITPEKYPEFRQLLLTLQMESNRTILLEQ